MKNNEKFLETSLFQYSGYPCHCEKDIKNVTPGEPPKTTLKMYSDINQELLFSYAAGEGLNLTGIAGGQIEKNILGKLLSISSEDIEQHISFFEKYGFLLPLKPDEYEAVDAEDIISMINRIKATIRLMNSIGEHNYRSVLIHIAFLLYSEPVSFHIGDIEFSTCIHRFTKLLNSNRPFPEIDRDDEVAAIGTYSVPDTMTDGVNKINFDFFNAVRQGKATEVNGSQSPWFKSLISMYVGCRDVSQNERILIDFLYHFQTEVAVFKDISFSKIVPFSPIDENSFTEEIKNSLLNVARIVVEEEINYNIRNIHPIYDGSTLKPAWRVNTLIEALYFSIFYMKAGSEIYKECENPKCRRDKFFLVETTRTNKKYCCPQCANAAAAQRHRARKLKNKA
jgi:hypothetical protein